jgi:hypothetical protein
LIEVRRERRADEDRRNFVKILNSTRLALAALALSGLALTGCLSDNGSDRTEIVLKMGVKELNASANSLSKSSTIELKKLIITLSSNGVGDSVIRDTLLAGTNGFVSNPLVEQTFSKKFQIKPLRHWTIVVKTLDARDSVIHRDSVVERDLKLGETRNITLDLSSRFVMYEVKFALPDSIKSTVTGMAQKILIHRFVMKVDSSVAIDTTVPGAFAPAPTLHAISFDYIKAGTTPDVTLQYYGRAAGNPNDTLLFEKILLDVKPDSNYAQVTATYVGPGSNGQGGATANMVFNIGKVGKTQINLDIDGRIPQFKAAR